MTELLMREAIKKGLEEALEQSKEGRLHILSEMMKTMSESRTEPKPHSPKMVTMTIPKDFIVCCMSFIDEA